MTDPNIATIRALLSWQGNGEHTPEDYQGAEECLDAVERTIDDLRAENERWKQATWNAYPNIDAIREAFRYAQGYDVPGWAPHQRNDEVEAVYVSALNEIVRTIADLRAENERLMNRLNADSQNFTILCLREQQNLDQARLREANDARVRLEKVLRVARLIISDTVQPAPYVREDVLDRIDAALAKVEGDDVPDLMQRLADSLKVEGDDRG